MRSSTLWGAVLTAALVFSVSVPAQADSPYLGEISLFAGDFAPRGWAFCDGQALEVAHEEAMFRVLGTTYGGDGTHDFKLPDLRKTEAKLREDAGIAKDAVGLRYIIALAGIDPSNGLGEPGDRYHLGQVMLCAGTIAPPGWLSCEGHIVSIGGHNEALFHLLGTSYGGDGTNDFKVPDLRKTEARLREDAGIAKDAKGLHYFIAIKGSFPASTARTNHITYIGEISLFAGNFALAPCDGTALQISQHTAQFSVMGTTYGGDGRNDFKLPDLRKAEAKLREDAGLAKDANFLRYDVDLNGTYPRKS